MKKIVFRINKEYFDEIRDNSKTVEFRSFTTFWKKRLQPLSDFYAETLALLQKHQEDGDFPNGEKGEEFKKDVQRVLELNELSEAEAVFICGKDVLQRKIIGVKYIPTPSNIDKRLVRTASCYAINIAYKE